MLATRENPQSAKFSAFGSHDDASATQNRLFTGMTVSARALPLLVSPLRENCRL
jgi:hypothetical protein